MRLYVHSTIPAIEVGTETSLYFAVAINHATHMCRSTACMSIPEIPNKMMTARCRQIHYLLTADYVHEILQNSRIVQLLKNIKEMKYLVYCIFKTNKWEECDFLSALRENEIEEYLFVNLGYRNNQFLLITVRFIIKKMRMNTFEE